MCYGQKLGFSKNAEKRKTNCYWEGWGMAVGQIMMVKELQSFAKSHEDIPSDLVLLFFLTLSEFLFTLTTFHSWLIKSQNEKVKMSKVNLTVSAKSSL